jgi:large subunit ribosomal protein L25
VKLIAKKRDILGKKVKALRRQGMLPGVVFGKGMESIPITLDQKDFEKVYEEAGESTLIDVEITDGGPRRPSGQIHKTLISEVDLDPVSDEIIHANLQAVSLTEKTTATVPIEIVGESPIVKSGEGMLLTLLDEIDVEALPQDLPSEIKVDISGLTEIDQGITIKDLSVDRSKVEIEQDPEDLVVKIEHAEMEEEEEEEEEPTVEAVEVTTEKKEEVPESQEGQEEPEPKKDEAKEQS